MKQQTPTNNSAVTWDAPDQGVWSAETAHNGGVTSVPLRDIMEQSFSEGFRSSLAPLGVPLSHVEARHVNGWPYVSFFLHDVPRKAGPPPPDLILKLLTRLHPGFRRRTKIAAAAIAENRALAMTDDWFAERQSWISRILELQKRDLDAMNSHELANHLQQIAKLNFDSLRRHFELIAGCIPLGHWLGQSKEWNLNAAEARSAVMHGTPVHDDARRRLCRIADALGKSTPQTFDSIRSHSAEAAAALGDYLDHHGWWAAEDNLTSGRMIDYPAAILRSIEAHRSSSPAVAEFDAAACLGKLRAVVPEAERSTFDRVTSDAHRAHTMLDDNSGILASWVTGLSGYVLTYVGKRLQESGQIDSAAHVHALTLEELTELLVNNANLTAEEVGRRYADWIALGQLTPPLHLNGEPSPPPDPGVFPAPVAQLVADIGAFLDDKFNDQHHQSGIGKRSVIGRAVVAASASEAIERLEDGDILVTTATTPAYNNILPVAGGLVVSEGGPSCHAAIVARELDLPTIVGFDRATILIPDGAIIELDPVAATVRITN